MFERCNEEWRLVSNVIVENNNEEEFCENERNVFSKILNRFTLFRTIDIQRQEKVFDVYYPTKVETNLNIVEYQSYEQQEDRRFY